MSELGPIDDPPGVRGGEESDASSPTWRRHPRLLLALVPLALLLLLLGLVAGTWWIGTPRAPSLEELLDTAPPTAPAHGGPGLDAEQSAFLEDDASDLRDVAVDERLEEAARGRTRRESLDRSPTGGAPDFTDFDAIRYLAGAWRLELGRDRFVHLRFDSAPAGHVPRDGYRVTVFRVDGARWPYFTVVSLSDGRHLLAFLDADGRFRDLLENFEARPPTHLAYNLPGSSRRLTGIRLRR
ncbi:MAG: hypothetical protein AAGC60_20315 [Acidobacteriota bacterium]